MHIKDYENSIKVRKEIGFDFHDLKNYGLIKNKSIITCEVLTNLKSNVLTKFGKRNRQGIAEIVDVYLDIYHEKYGKTLLSTF